MDELANSTIAIVGFGGIGRTVAQRARAFGMYVIGVARTNQPKPAADEMFAIADIALALPRADTIVVTLPETATTRGLIDRALIASWRSSAVFINVGRDAIVEKDALTDALADNTIRGAVLDVFLSNVIFSPHTAALSVHENKRIVNLFCDNIQRFAQGEQLRNVANVKKFYRSAKQPKPDGCTPLKLMLSISDSNTRFETARRCPITARAVVAAPRICEALRHVKE